MKSYLDSVSDVRAALRIYLDWMDGFEESSLYKDYREAEGFTNEEWDKVLTILDKFLKEEAPDA